MENKLSDELQHQIEKEAEEYGDKTGFDTTGYYSTHQDRENSYLAGAEKYALKLQQAEERLEQMAKALEWIKIYPTTDDVIKLYIEQHLTEYNQSKGQKIFIGNPNGYCYDCGFPVDECNCPDEGKEGKV